MKFFVTPRAPESFYILEKSAPLELALFGLGGDLFEIDLAKSAHKYVKRTGSPGAYKYWYQGADGHLEAQDQQQGGGRIDHVKRLLVARMQGSHAMGNDAVAAETGHPVERVRSIQSNLRTASKNTGVPAHDYTSSHLNEHEKVGHTIPHDEASAHAAPAASGHPVGSRAWERERLNASEAGREFNAHPKTRQSSSAQSASAPTNLGARVTPQVPGPGARGMSSVAPNGQIKMKKPKTAAEATQLLTEVAGHHASATANHAADPSHDNALRAAHAGRQLTRAASMGQKAVDAHRASAQTVSAERASPPAPSTKAPAERAGSPAAVAERVAARRTRETGVASGLSDARAARTAAAAPQTPEQKHATAIKEIKDKVNGSRSDSGGPSDHHEDSHLSFGLDRYRRHDHGGGSTGDGWLPDHEIEKDRQKGRDQHGHHVKAVNKVLEKHGYHPNASLALGEKGHLSLEVPLKKSAT